MHRTIDLLIKGDDRILIYFKKALDRWNEILKSDSAKDVETLAKKLTSEQFWFEHNCGTRWIGQEIMVITGICQFYSISIGFEETKEKALLVYNAFMASSCSIEVKGDAKDVAKSYYLIDESDFRI